MSERSEPEQSVKSIVFGNVQLVIWKEQIKIHQYSHTLKHL